LAPGLAKKIEDSSTAGTGRTCTNGESRENKYSCSKSIIAVDKICA